VLQRAACGTPSKFLVAQDLTRAGPAVSAAWNWSWSIPIPFCIPATVVPFLTYLHEDPYGWKQQTETGREVKDTFSALAMGMVAEGLRGASSCGLSSNKLTSFATD